MGKSYVRERKGSKTEMKQRVKRRQERELEKKSELEEKLRGKKELDAGGGQKEKRGNMRRGDRMT